jgi:hypothetical protein
VVIVNAPVASVAVILVSVTGVSEDVMAVLLLPEEAVDEESLAVVVLSDVVVSDALFVVEFTDSVTLVDSETAVVLSVFLCVDLTLVHPDRPAIMAVVISIAMYSFLLICEYLAFILSL